MKETKSYFVLTVPMKYEKWQTDILKKRFRFIEVFYNDVQGHLLKKYNRMIHEASWKAREKKIIEIYKECKDDAKERKKRCKPLFDEKNQVIKEYGFTQFSVTKTVNEYRKRGYEQIVDSSTAYWMAANLWSGFEKVLFSSASTIHAKRRDTLMTIGSPTNASGVRVKQGKDGKYYCVWGKKLKMLLELDLEDPYQVEAFQNTIKYCRIKRILVRTGWKYYCQMIFEGEVPARIDKKTGEFKRYCGKGAVEITIEKDKVRVVPADTKKEQSFILSPNLKKEEERLAALDREIEHLRRIHNPDNFDEKGRVKKREELRPWKYSKHYERLRRKRQWMMRHIQRIRQLDHEWLANEILKMGDDFVVHQAYLKAEELQKDAKQKIRKEERKVQLDRSPSMFCTILQRKAGYYPCTMEIQNGKS